MTTTTAKLSESYEITSYCDLYCKYFADEAAYEGAEADETAYEGAEADDDDADDCKGCLYCNDGGEGTQIFAHLDFDEDEDDYGDNTAQASPLFRAILDDDVGMVRFIVKHGGPITYMYSIYSRMGDIQSISPLQYVQVKEFEVNPIIRKLIVNRARAIGASPIPPRDGLLLCVENFWYYEDDEDDF